TGSTAPQRGAELEGAQDGVRDGEMCTTKGTGELLRRGLAGDTSGPPDTSTRRSVPAIAGSSTRVTSANGTPPVDHVDRGRRAAVTVTSRRPDRAASRRSWAWARRPGCAARATA